MQNTKTWPEPITTVRFSVVSFDPPRWGGPSSLTHKEQSSPGSPAALARYDGLNETNLSCSIPLCRGGPVALTHREQLGRDHLHALTRHGRLNREIGC